MVKYNRQIALQVISRTEKFQASLIKVGFLSSACTALTDYTSNVNVLFANKKSQEILEKARLICNLYPSTFVKECHNR